MRLTEVRNGRKRLWNPILDEDWYHRPLIVRKLMALTIFMYAVSRMLILTLSAAGKAVYQTLVCETLGILMDFIPHDGKKNEIIYRAGKKLVVSFTGTGDWDLDEMACATYSAFTGRGVEGRFEVGAFLFGNANIGIEMDDELITFTPADIYKLGGELDLLKSFSELKQMRNSIPALEQEKKPEKLESPKVLSKKIETTYIVEEPPSDTEEDVHDFWKDDGKDRRKKEDFWKDDDKDHREKKNRPLNTGNAKRKPKITPNAVKMEGLTSKVFLGKKQHMDKCKTPERGEAYGYVWEKFKDGVKLVCETMVAIHLLDASQHDTSRHGFPDMMSKVVPERVNSGDKIEVWTSTGLREFIVDGSMMVLSRFGKRTIWGIVPTFFCEEKLGSGTPIFKNGKLVSVVTKSNGGGMYAISGIAGNSGHFKSHRVRVRKMETGQSVYGKLIGNYNEVKAEAMREKAGKDNTLNYEICVGESDVRIIGWKGDNEETFHVRLKNERPLVTT